MKTLSYHPEASEEIDQAYNWYAVQSVQAADGFFEELFSAVKNMRYQPGLFSPYLHGTRRVMLKQYPYFVVFRELPRKIQIVAVAHAKRRPGYWKGRV